MDKGRGDRSQSSKIEGYNEVMALLQPEKGTNDSYVDSILKSKGIILDAIVTYKPYFLNISSIALFALSVITSHIAVKYNKMINSFDCMLVKSFSMNLTMILIVGLYQVNIYKPFLRYCRQLLTCVALGLIWIVMYSYGRSLVRRTESFLIYYSNPVFTWFLAVCMTRKESMTRSGVIWVIVAFVGVILISIDNKYFDIFGTKILGIITMLISTLAHSLMWLMIKIVNRTTHQFIFWFYLSLGTLITNLCILYFTPKEFNIAYYTIYDFSVLLVSGIFTAIAYWLMSLAYKNHSISKLVPYNYSGLILIILNNSLFLKSDLTLSDLSGIFLIIVSLIWFTYITYLNKETAEQKEKSTNKTSSFKRAGSPKHRRLYEKLM